MVKALLIVGVRFIAFGGRNAANPRMIVSVSKNAYLILDIFFWVLTYLRLDLNRRLLFRRLFLTGLLHILNPIILIGDEVDVYLYGHGAQAGDDFF